MAARLQEIVRTEDVMKNSFRNRERAAVIKSEIAAETDSVKRWLLLPRLADEELRAGDLADALASYEKFERGADAVGQTIQSKQQMMLQHEKAICHLRIGEQQNCLTNHTIESCLFPIRKLGVYQRQEGPREAIRILTETLQQFRGDLKGIWLLNIAYMTLGEYPEKVPPQWVIPPRVFESEYDIKPFVDVASGAGLDIPGWAGGCVVDDFDGDGFLDVMLSSWEIRSRCASSAAMATVLLRNARRKPG